MFSPGRRWSQGLVRPGQPGTGLAGCRRRAKPPAPGSSRPVAAHSAARAVTLPAARAGCSVAVSPSDWLGEPHQLPPRTTPPDAPLTVLPLARGAPEGLGGAGERKRGLRPPNWPRAPDPPGRAPPPRSELTRSSNRAPARSPPTKTACKSAALPTPNREAGRDPPCYADVSLATRRRAAHAIPHAAAARHHYPAAAR